MTECSKCHKPFESERYKTCEQCREAMHKWSIANRDKRRESTYRWRNTHPERWREIEHKYYKKNHEKITERQRRYSKTHVNEKLEYMRGYYQTNREKKCAYQSEYNKDNRERRNITEHNRRARINGNGGALPLDARTTLFEEQEGLCYLCGKPLYASFDDPVSIEHKIPVSRGGSNDISNIGLAHLSCNCRKHTKTHEEFLMNMKL